MARRPVPEEKPLDWIGSSKKDFLKFPRSVISDMGYALGLAQLGGLHPSAKSWKGQGPGVFELVESFDGNAYRAVYTVRFADIIYVLHAFQKKSTRGIKTAKTDIDLAARRLRLAQADYEARFGKERENEVITRGTKNVFADLGFRDADERQTKLRLALAINGAVAERKLTQVAAAELLNLNQPKISALANYRLQGFSVERLMTLLNALDRDVEIVIKKKPNSRSAKITVMAP